MDKVRVLRVIEYIGTREAVERVIARSIHGVKKVDNNLEIRAATIGIYPEILENLSEDKGEIMYERNRSNWNQQEVLQEPLEPIDASEFGVAAVEYRDKVEEAQKEEGN